MREVIEPELARVHSSIERIRALDKSLSGQTGELTHFSRFGFPPGARAPCSRRGDRPAALALARFAW